MIRVAVVDDEPLARRGVLARIAGHADLVVDGEYGDGAEALEHFKASPPDVAFIDVQMPGLDGLALLAALPPERRPLAILLTAHEGFAVRAFGLNAVDYLLKPVDDLRFAEALDRARQRLVATARQVGGQAAGTARPCLRRFQVRVGRRLKYVDVDAIEWIEADGDYAMLHVGGDTHLVRESLHCLANRIDPGRFVRIHRSTIVRLDRVAELQPLTNRDAMLRLHDGTPLRVSRTYIDQLLAGLGGAIPA